MCVYNGRKVTRAEFIRIMSLEKELKNAMDSPLGNGFDYSQWPIVRPAANGELDISMAHWEFIPDWVHSKADFPEFRKKYITLIAKGETLVSSPMYGDAALRRRCLVLSSHFFEYRQVGKVKVPYRVSLKDQEYFYIAGVWQRWTDKINGKSGDTFSMVTTAANSFMAQVHNIKLRMPTILPEELAHDWLFKPLTPRQITRLATHQIPSDMMQAYTVSKDFRTSSDPEKEETYENIPALTY